jgi:DNA repair exonuclease SbcCD ATPase subunit
VANKAPEWLSYLLSELDAANDSLNEWRRKAVVRRAETTALEDLLDAAKSERDQWKRDFEELNRDGQEIQDYYKKVARTLWPGNDVPDIDRIAKEFKTLQQRVKQAEQALEKIEFAYTRTGSSEQIAMRMVDIAIDTLSILRDEASPLYVAHGSLGELMLKEAEKERSHGS